MQQPYEMSVSIVVIGSLVLIDDRLAQASWISKRNVSTRTKESHTF